VVTAFVAIAVFILAGGTIGNITPLSPISLNAATNDTCGYAELSGDESSAIFDASYGHLSSVGDQIYVWGADETGINDGVGGTPMANLKPTNVTVDGKSIAPGEHMVIDSTHTLGDPTATDSTGRLVYPVLFATRVNGLATTDANYKSGDQEVKGNGHNVSVEELYGAWTSLISSTKNAGVPNANVANGTVAGKASAIWGLAHFSDAANEYVSGPVDHPGETVPAVYKDKIGTEMLWNVSTLESNAKVWDPSTSAYVKAQPGDTIRVEVQIHDGDQNHAGGDFARFCTTVTIPTSNVSTHPEGGSLGHIKEPIGTQIKDVATITATNFHGTSVTDPAGAVTFSLYAPGDSTCANAIFTDVQTHTTAGTDYTSNPFVNGGFGANQFGTYTWQASYHDSSGSYPDSSEACGDETVQTVNARVLLSPYSAINVVGVSHVLTATVQSSTDNSNWTGAGSVSVAFCYVASNACGATVSATPNPPTPCDGTAGHGALTDTNGNCTTTISDQIAETLAIRASATNFTVNGVTGTFTRATSAHGNCSPSSSSAATTCDAQKQYINPTTTLTVTDTLNCGSAGCPSGDTVTYGVFVDSSCNTPSTLVGTGTNGGTITSSTPSSQTYTVAAGTGTVYFQAILKDGTGTQIFSSCSPTHSSVESVSDGS